MRAMIYEHFRGPLRVERVPDPEPPPDGVVIRVCATGLSRSDGHGWMGHDPDIHPPHVPGHELASGGVHLSLDALGSHLTCRHSVLSLRKRGRHVQVGLLLGDERDPPLPMAAVIGKELEIVGSHGMPAHAYPALLELIEAGRLEPARLVTRTIPLEQAPACLAAMGQFGSAGITVVDRV